jgi:hypothetical protein
MKGDLHRYRDFSVRHRNQVKYVVVLDRYMHIDMIERYAHQIVLIKKCDVLFCSFNRFWVSSL